METHVGSEITSVISSQKEEKKLEIQNARVSATMSETREAESESIII